MSARIRRAICEKISQATGLGRNVYHELEVPTKRPANPALSTLHWAPTAGNTTEELIQLIPRLEFDKSIVESVKLLPATGKIAARVEFQLQSQPFVETLLQQNVEPATKPHAHIVFEFSSPNIAKPFHVGHLRSTIIGNALANLHQHLGYQVTRLNYLGDWGTQFGMLHVGVKMLDITDEQMRTKPIETLYSAYVAANTAAKTDASIADKARECFAQLELGTDAEMARQWQNYRNYTVAELEQMYARLGVRYDQYDWESQYSQRQIGDVLDCLQQHGLLQDEGDGRKVVSVDGRRIPVVKSDGSSLYLTRDIAAVLDRFRRYNFQRMYYVVENGQADHFNALFKTTSALTADIPLERLMHVKFGRIHGMSTRSGKVVFLRDVLDEAQNIMLEKQLKSATTKVELTNTSGGNKNIADILGVSAVIINDLKQRRQRDYDFNWQKALQVNGDTGIKLQYTHCRLHSLLMNMAHINVSECKVDVAQLAEPEAQDLLHEIARFEQAVWLAKQQLEACVLVNHLFALCNTTSRALKHLNIKNEECREKQQNRLLLFSAAKRNLNTGMCILGLRPLDQM
ncbi:probable arginine--tRNA ligase, mitochondrial [Rhagoletis pomonella]|uniref:probable arginine--tRNA ligase, mitochondrial n=1 Tax=Rhagoletis pomonella TaxID=28610 RepID=UPI0017832AC7|nr:probable arginine--tRNA ligase, mitochondrial [Rhagoletis pomonella]